MTGDSSAAELTATVCFSPLVFVYGEFLPKYLYFNAPSLLLRRSGPVLLACAVAFAPASAMLWLLGVVLQSVLGETPLRVRPALARQELQGVLEEGHEVGILPPAQRDLARNLFAMTERRVAQCFRPAWRAGAVSLGDQRQQVLRWARRHAAAVLPVVDPATGEPAGYVRVVDLALSDRPVAQQVRPLPKLAADASPIAALVQLQTEGEELAQVVDENGSTIGLLYATDLTDSLMRASA